MTEINITNVVTYEAMYSTINDMDINVTCDVAANMDNDVAFFRASDPFVIGSIRNWAATMGHFSAYYNSKIETPLNSQSYKSKEIQPIYQNNQFSTQDIQNLSSNLPELSFKYGI